MAEKKETRYENIKKASELLSKDGKIEELLKASVLSQKSVKNLKSALEEKLKAFEKARIEKQQQQEEVVEVKQPEKVEVAEIKCTAKDEYEKALCEKMEEQRKHYQETWSKYGYQCMDDNPCPED